MSMFPTDNSETKCNFGFNQSFTVEQRSDIGSLLTLDKSISLWRSGAESCYSIQDE